MKKRRRYCPECDDVDELVKLKVEPREGRISAVVCPRCGFEEEFRGQKKKVRYSKVEDHVPKNN